MHKKMLFIPLCLLAATMLSGCWDYRSLNEITIVSGMAVDINEETGQYLITFEVADLTGDVKNQGPKARIVQAEGRTLFDAIRNAKMRDQNKLYFASTQIVVISHLIAENEDIGGIVRFFLAESECRDTVYLAVSMEGTARDILMTEDEDESIQAFILSDIIAEDNQNTSSTSSVMLYNIYNTIKAEGKSLTLPLLHQTLNVDKPVNELDGTAVYKAEKMIGTLNPIESKYFLFATDKVRGGILTLPLDEGEIYEISLEISKNSTQRSYDEVNGEVVIHIKTDTDVSLAESKLDIDMTDETQIKALEAAASAIIEKNIESVVKKVQTDYNSDIFGFGNMINMKNHKLWTQLSPQWETMFPTLKVEVESDVHILNTVFIETKGK